jgi:hypothetical protein
LPDIPPRKDLNAHPYVQSKCSLMT